MGFSLATFPDYGLPVRVADGSLAVIVAALTPGHVLVVGFDGLHEMANEAIVQRPAICVRCKQSVWWWWHQDFVLLCCCGARPDSDWREEVFSVAASFIRKAEAKSSVGLTRILGQALATGGWQYWRQLQRFAFAEAVPKLLTEWDKRQQGAR